VHVAPAAVTINNQVDNHMETPVVSVTNHVATPSIINEVPVPSVHNYIEPPNVMLSPVVNVTPPHVNVEAPTVHVAAPQVTNNVLTPEVHIDNHNKIDVHAEAPAVTVEAPKIHVEAPTVHNHIPQATASATAPEASRPSDDSARLRPTVNVSIDHAVINNGCERVQQVFASQHMHQHHHGSTDGAAEGYSNYEADLRWVFELLEQIMALPFAASTAALTVDLFSAAASKDAAAAERVKRIISEPGNSALVLATLSNHLTLQLHHASQGSTNIRDLWSRSPLRQVCTFAQDTIPVARNILRLGQLFCDQPEEPTVQQVRELLPPPAPPAQEAPTAAIEAPTRALMWEKALRLLVYPPARQALPSFAAPPSQQCAVADSPLEAMALLMEVGRGAYSSRSVLITERHDTTGEERTTCMVIVSSSKKSIEAVPFGTSSDTVQLPRRHWTIVRVCLGQLAPLLASSGTQH
jgi:hypothetical protein